MDLFELPHCLALTEERGETALVVFLRRIARSKCSHLVRLAMAYDLYDLSAIGYGINKRNSDLDKIHPYSDF